jgi:hypothetical protein
VAQVTLSGLELGIDANRTQLAEKNGRIFYSSVTQGVIGRLIGQILGGPTDRPTAGVTIQFLFRGDEPLELTLYTPQPVPLVLQPRADNPRRFERDIAQWWRHYNAYWRQQHAEDNQPPLVSTYLTAMLAQRLGLEPPLLERLQAKEASATTTQSLELMLGMERLRLEALKNTMLGRSDFSEVANLPLPAEPAWSPLSLPADAAAEIEPIALHVPQDWFYVRFGRFSK